LNPNRRRRSPLLKGCHDPYAHELTSPYPVPYRRRKAFNKHDVPTDEPAEFRTITDARVTGRILTVDEDLLPVRQAPRDSHCEHRAAHPAGGRVCQVVEKCERIMNRL
jgi:hypothetical protein